MFYNFLNRARMKIWLSKHLRYKSNNELHYISKEG